MANSVGGGARPAGRRRVSLKEIQIRTLVQKTASLKVHAWRPGYSERNPKQNCTKPFNPLLPRGPYSDWAVTNHRQ
jgi:hypothetical protein